jgi:hypothetical protein
MSTKKKKKTMSTVSKTWSIKSVSEAALEGLLAAQTNEYGDLSTSIDPKAWAAFATAAGAAGGIEQEGHAMTKQKGRVRQKLVAMFATMSTGFDSFSRISSSGSPCFKKADDGSSSPCFANAAEGSGPDNEGGSGAGGSAAASEDDRKLNAGNATIAAIESGQTDAAELKKQIEAAEAQAVEHAAMVNGLKEREAAAQQSVAEQEKKIVARMAQVKHIEQLMVQNEQLQERIEEVHIKWQQLATEKAQLMMRARNEAASKMQLEEELAEALASISKMKQKLKEQEAEIKKTSTYYDVEAALASKTNALDHMAKTSTANIAELEAKLEEQAQAVAVLGNKLKAQTQIVIAAELKDKEIEEKKATIKALELQLGVKMSQLVTKNREIQSLKQAVHFKDHLTKASNKSGAKGSTKGGGRGRKPQFRKENEQKT